MTPTELATGPVPALIITLVGFAAFFAAIVRGDLVAGPHYRGLLDIIRSLSSNVEKQNAINEALIREKK